MGRVYRKLPWFESLIARDDAFTEDDVSALRYYRNTFEAAQRSETKCSLASMVHGSGGGNDEPSLAVARAKSTLAFIEPLLGPLAETVRLIAIEDFTYEQVAMGRFGYRYADYYNTVSGAFEKRPRPKSGRHPTIVKDEFVTGCKRLTAAVHRRPVENRAADADFPAAAEVSGGSGSVGAKIVTERLAGEIQRRVEAGRPVGTIDIAANTIRDIIREQGFVGQFADQAEQVAEMFEHCFAINMDWLAGWVLNDVGKR